MTHSRESFTVTLLENLRKRSNTMHGKDASPMSEKKGVLAVSGDELANRARENMLRVADAAWETRMTLLTPNVLQHILCSWYDLGHRGLQTIHKEDNDDILLDAKTLDQRTGVLHPTNPRYRRWQTAYSDHSPAPTHLGLWMDVFCAELIMRLARLRPHDNAQLAHFLAWADYEMDWVGHLWNDGCGRLSTVLVCWLALRIPGASLPVFGSREEHYGEKKSFERHVEYFRRCLSHK